MKQKIRSSVMTVCLTVLVGAPATLLAGVASREKKPLVTTPQSIFKAVHCEGTYRTGHLQGVATDGRSAIFWSWTGTLAKTDLRGGLLNKVSVPPHHGDLCFHDGKVFVAVNFGAFNELPGRADSWVYVYDAATLDFLERHPVPEVVYGAGGLAHHNGRFIVVGGLVPGKEENYLYEYDKNFRFIESHVLKSGYTLMGIQTATWSDGAWWFGCYGSPPVLLRADENFRFTGREEFNAALGLAALPDGRFYIGQNTLNHGEGTHVGRVFIARKGTPDPMLLLEAP